MLNTAKQQVQDHPEVNQAFFAEDAPAARVPESNLAIRLQRFTTTLALTGIADRDLALPLQKDLNANLLFLLQLEDILLLQRENIFSVVIGDYAPVAEGDHSPVATREYSVVATGAYSPAAKR